MKQLKSISQNLISQVQTQLGDLKNTNAKELGEVVDMIKDLEEAMYYCAITTAMEEKKDESSKSQSNMSYYMEPNRYIYRDEPKVNYYTEDGNSMSGGRPYTPYMEYAPYMMANSDWRDRHMYDGRSGMSRRMYMEGKQYHMNDEQQSMKELEHYLKDLSDDLVEMVKESTPEEKQVLSTKLQTLATKVNK